MTKEDKQKLFKKVVQSNIDMLSNHISTNAFNYSVLNISDAYYENHVRNMAVEFFYIQLSKRLTEHLTNKL